LVANFTFFSAAPSVQMSVEILNSYFSTISTCIACRLLLCSATSQRLSAYQQVDRGLPCTIRGGRWQPKAAL